MGEVFLWVLCPFFDWSSFFCCSWVVEVLCIFWILDRYWRCCLQIYFPLRMVVSLPCWWLLLLCRSFSVWGSLIHLFCFDFLCLWGQIHKILFKSKVLEFCSYVFFSAFYCFRSYIQALNPFGVILVCGVRQQSSFILLKVAFQFSQHLVLKRLSFLHCMFLAFFFGQKLCLHKHEFISGLLILFHWSMCMFFCLCHAVLIIVTL